MPVAHPDVFLLVDQKKSIYSFISLLLTKKHGSEMNSTPLHFIVFISLISNKDTVTKPL